MFVIAQPFKSSVLRAFRHLKGFNLDQTLAYKHMRRLVGGPNLGQLFFFRSQFLDL